MNKLRFIAITAVMGTAILAIPSTQGQNPYADMVGRALREDRQLDTVAKACAAAGNNPHTPACQQTERLTQQMRAKTGAMRRQNQMTEGQVRSLETWNRANAAQMKQQNRKSAFQYQRDADYWSAQERSARDAGNNWAAESARQKAEYSRQKAHEYNGR